jgi:hypothetical protein
VRSDDSTAGVPYWDVVDLIEFPDTPQPLWLRIGYYRMAKDRLVWGSQTTITEPIHVWRRLLVEAVRAMPWFRSLLEEVLRDATAPRADPDGHPEVPAAQ